jgi:hypothetical protein
MPKPAIAKHYFTRGGNRSRAYDSNEECEAAARAWKLRHPSTPPIQIITETSDEHNLRSNFTQHYRRLDNA